MDGIQSYQENAVTTQSPENLIVMLVDGAIRFLNKAIEELDAKNHGEKGKYITRALDIINELDVSLDMETGGDISQNLRSLYDFMRRHLNQANIKKDPEMIREVINILQDLNEGWKVVAS